MCYQNNNKTKPKKTPPKKVEDKRFFLKPNVNKDKKVMCCAVLWVYCKPLNASGTFSEEHYSVNNKKKYSWFHISVLLCWQHQTVRIPVSSVFGNISLSLALYTYNWFNVCNLAKEILTIPNSSALITSLIVIFHPALAHFSICPCDTYTCKMKNHKNPFSRLLEEILTTTNVF